MISWAVLGSVDSRSREGILPLCSALGRQSWSVGSSVDLPSTRETRTYWRKSHKRAMKMVKGLEQEAERAGIVQTKVILSDAQ